MQHVGPGVWGGGSENIPEGMSHSLLAACRLASTWLLLEMGRVGRKCQPRVIAHHSGKHKGLELPVETLPLSAVKREAGQLTGL